MNLAPLDRGVRLVSATGQGSYDADMSLPYCVVVTLRPPDFMTVTFVLLHGGAEVIVARGEDLAAIEAFVTRCEIETHPRFPPADDHRPQQPPDREVTLMSRRKPEPFSDSFTTEEAEISVAVKIPWGESTEAVVIKIDCVGAVHGDEEFTAMLINMLELAKENLAARRPRPKRPKTFGKRGR